MSLECQKGAFSIAPHVHYLNCAYMSPLAKVVEDVGLEAVKRKRTPSDIAPSDFFEGVERVRSLFAKIVGAPKSSSVALVPSVSYGMATVANNLSVQPGQNIVTVEAQFPSNMYAWRRVTTSCHAELRVVRAPETTVGRAEGWNERLLASIDQDTALVAMAPVHWTDGTVFDLMTIGDKTRQVGAVFAIDGTQAIGALPFDVRDVRPDALICSGYKWLMGPYSTGLAYFSDRLLSGVPLEETWMSRTDSEDFNGLVNYRDTYRDGAVRFDVGEVGNFILVPMLIRALELVLSWGVESIAEYIAALSEGFIDTVRSHGYGVDERSWRARHMFGLRLPTHLTMSQVGDELKRRNISAAPRGGILRVSPHVYNDQGDMDALHEALVSLV